MKAYLFVVALTLFAACGKKNNVAVLEHEAVMLSKFYQPKLDALDARLQEIYKRGKAIPGTAPGVEDVGKRVQEAKATLDKLHAIISPPQPAEKSAVEKQAEEAAKAGKVEDLEKLVHDTETALDDGITVINDNLNTVEGWISQYDTKTLAAAAAPAAAPQPEQPSPEPAQPVNPAQPPAPSQPAPKK